MNFLDVLLRIDRRTQLGWAISPIVIGTWGVVTADGSLFSTLLGGFLTGYGLFLVNCWDDDGRDLSVHVESGSRTDEAFAEVLSQRGGST